jgi:hypothetical protein
MRPRFTLRTGLLLLLLLGAGLAYWQHRERVELQPLIEAQERTLVQWRAVKALCDLHGTLLAVDEAEARERYFDNRKALETAVAASWWPGNLLPTRRRR